MGLLLKTFQAVELLPGLRLRSPIAKHVSAVVRQFPVRSSARASKHARHDDDVTALVFVIEALMADGWLARQSDLPRSLPGRHRALLPLW
jgi:hypothetical protein